MFSIIKLTFREAFSQKLLIVFFGISTFFCLFLLFVLSLNVVDDAQGMTEIMLWKMNAGGDLNLTIEEVVKNVEAGIAAALYIIGLFLSLFATSNLIPSMLQPGNIGLVLSKPISRTKILSGRYLGALAIIGFNISYLVLFSWLILSVKSGVWNFNYLLSAVLIFLIYAILYAIVVFFGILTGGSAVSLMSTYAIIFISPIFLVRERMYAFIDESNRKIIDAVYYIIPKISELGKIVFDVTKGNKIESLVPLWSSLVFGFVIFMISLIIFKKKDF